MGRTTADSIDDYIAQFPEHTQKALSEVRSVIAQAAPEAVETISYAIPTFDVRGTHLVHFAGYERHVGFYPAPTGMEAFKAEFAGYKTGKGSVQFPLDAPMPTDLIRRIVEFRLGQLAPNPEK